VYLCFKHHNRFDAKQLQGKNISAGEIEHARKMLYERMGDPADSLFNVTVELDRDFDSFTDDNQHELLTVIKQILGKGGDIVVKQRCRGSVLVTLQLRGDETERLIAAIRSGDLKSQQVIDATIDYDAFRPTEFVFVEAYDGGITPEAFSKQHILEIVRRPDKQQGLSSGRIVPVSNAGCILATKSFGRQAAKGAYTALVILSHGRATQEIVAGFRVYSSEIPHSADWEPLNILKAFVDKYGFEVEYTGVATGRLFQALWVPFPPSVSSYSRLGLYLNSIRKYVSGETGPAEHPTVFRVDPFSSRAFIELGFSISVRPYGLALRRHGIRVSRRLLKTSPNDKS